ncbi:hypothetical protein POTOM_019736 [Populus tomentosa]|uniref:Uncharacterized protein n=1 Tax=Populus tomentosa TaxID=118781 RepID=A0A8X8A812_POPTO|nr:hypothetical protein POTOM_019736 [Populus tomentosa]
MGKKRKSIATSLDEVDRTMYASFCSAANSLSQLYTQSMNHQKLSFQAGERQGLEKLYQWIWRQQEGGSRVATVDIINYIQKTALLNTAGYSAALPNNKMTILLLLWRRLELGFRSRMNWTIVEKNHQCSSGLTATAQGTRSEHCDQQPKNTVFSNALSSPIRRSLQNYHITQGGYCPQGGSPSGNGTRNNEPNFLQHQNRDPNPPILFRKEAMEMVTPF